MRSTIARGGVVAAALLGSVVIGGDGATAAPPRPQFGSARILTQFPSPPGYPEGIAVRDGVVYVAGPATFGTIGKGPSAVVAFDVVTGALVREFETVGEDDLAEHANSSIAFDGLGRLYVLNTQLGLYRLDVASGEQTTYGLPFPDLLPCSPLTPAPCSPTAGNAPSIPNDVAFDKHGNAYVSDSMQATIWRVPAGGGAPQIWFQDQRLASPYIGVNGLRLDPKGTRAFLTVTTDLQGGAYLYTLPLVAAPSATDLALFHSFAPGDLPDGIAFGHAGLLYVAMATPGASGVLALDPTGDVAFRLANAFGSPIAPYDSPANIAFDGKGSILLTNHAFVSGAAVPSQFSVVSTYVDDKGAVLDKPELP